MSFIHGHVTRTEHAMSLFSTIRSAERTSLPVEQPLHVPTSTLTGLAAAEPSLPRHLLVSLAGIIADTTSAQQRCVDTPQLHADLGEILLKLDGLVDSVYERVVAPSHHT
jgi:hypothetical protein